jgi:hypothetical protein
MLRKERGVSTIGHETCVRLSVVSRVRSVDERPIGVGLNNLLFVIHRTTIQDVGSTTGVQEEVGDADPRSDETKVQVQSAGAADGADGFW